MLPGTKPGGQGVPWWEVGTQQWSTPSSDTTTIRSSSGTASGATTENSFGRPAELSPRFLGFLSDTTSFDDRGAASGAATALPDASRSAVVSALENCKVGGLDSAYASVADDSCFHSHRQNVKQLDVAATGRSPVVRKARIAVQAAPGAAIAGAACPAEEPLLLR
jgi:hypothetical protein